MIARKGWAKKPLPETAWKAIEPHNRARNSREQDAAAGSEAARTMHIGHEKRALARVKFAGRRGARRVNAFLIWHEQGARIEWLIGEILLPTRAANLASTWKTIHEHRLLTPEGREMWRSRAHQPAVTDNSDTHVGERTGRPLG